jgi:eukaryotic-like serine/threonine-protein kinase
MFNIFGKYYEEGGPVSTARLLKVIAALTGTLVVVACLAVTAVLWCGRATVLARQDATQKLLGLHLA